MTRQEHSLGRTEALRQGWDELRACLEAFDAKVCEGDWHLLTDVPARPCLDIPADTLPIPADDALRKWYFATLATAGWIVTPRGPDERSRAGYWRVVSSRGYAWDSLDKLNPKEVG